MASKKGVFGNLFSPSISRASSRSDLSALGTDTDGESEHTEPPAAAAAPPVEQAKNGGRSEADSDNFEMQERRAKRKLANHPLGELLLPVLTCLYAMAGKVGQVDTPDFQTMEQLLSKVDTLVSDDTPARISAQIEAGIGKEEMTDHIRKTLFTSPLDRENIVNPPTHFATESYCTPDRASRFSALKFYFPMQPFSGSGDKITIVQFLQGFTRGAERMQGKLSEEDFRDLLLSKCTGKCHESLSLWMASNLTLKGIYHKLLSTFDNRETPQEAREKLEKLNPSFFNSLSNLILRVETLARRASLVVRGQANQEVIFNHLGTDFLEKCIAEPYRSNIVSMRLQLEQAADCSLPFEQYCSIVEKYDRQISSSLRKNYVPPKDRKFSGKQGAAIAATEAEKGGGNGPKKEGGTGGKRSNLGGGKKNDNGSGKDKRHGPPSPPAAEMLATSGSAAVPPTVRPKWKDGHDKGAAGTNPYVSQTREGVCPKCSGGGHSARDCENVEGPVSRYTCRRCAIGLFHFEAKCPFRKGKEQQNGGAGQSSRSPDPPKA